MKGLFGMAVAVVTAVSPVGAEVYNDSITCHIIGKVINRPDCKYVMLSKAGRDSRVNDSNVIIPVVNGEYSCTLRDDAPRAYNICLIDKGIATGMQKFFTGNGDVELISYDREHSESSKVVSSLPDNVLAARYKELSKVTKAVNDLIRKRDSISACSNAESKEFSAQFLENEARIKGLLLEDESFCKAFIVENPSIFGLYRVLDAFMNAAYVGYDVMGYADIFETVYKDAFPNHPYTAEIEMLIDATKVKGGNDYPDFKVTRPDGSTENIQSLIRGNVAVVDLWASWCAPCRRYSTDLIPLYEKYKDRGFKVVAIARENGNCDAMMKAMERDGYPWESFVDLNDRDHIWYINGAVSVGGRMILVGADGKVVDVDMPIEEVEKYLVATYGD